MFKITTGRDASKATRLVSSDQLTASDFLSVAAKLGVAPRRARKVGYVAAYQADLETRVETRWNGKETTAVAKPGDYVVTNLTANREVLRDAEGEVNTYVIKAAKFPNLYDRVEGRNEHGDVYSARGVVDVVFLSGGFDILAPWGEKQRAPSGYIVKNGDDIYGNNKETFEATYEIVR